MDLVAQLFPKIVGQTSAAVDAAAGGAAGSTSHRMDRLVDREDDVGDARAIGAARQQIAAAGTSLSVGGLGVLGLGRHARAQDAEEEALARSSNPRFLIVLSTTGGASMLDAMLAIRASESANAATLNCFPDSAVRTVGAFRAVDIDLPNLGAIPMPVKGRQSALVEAHQADIGRLMVCIAGTSVTRRDDFAVGLTHHGPDAVVDTGPYIPEGCQLSGRPITVGVDREVRKQAGISDANPVSISLTTGDDTITVTRNCCMAVVVAFARSGAVLPWLVDRFGARHGQLCPAARG